MSSKHIKTIAQHNFDWVHVTKTDPEILSVLQERFDLLDVDVKEVLPPNQRSKLVVRDKYVFMILHYPVYNRTSGRIMSAEVYFFVQKKSLITISPSGLTPLTNLYEQMKVGGVCLACDKPSQMFLYIVLDMLQSLFPMLVHMNNDIESVEEHIFDVDRKHRQNAVEILRIKTNLVNFKRSIQPYKALVEKFIGLDKIFVSKALVLDNQHVRDISIELWQMMQTQEATIDALHETHESLINNRTNQIMRTLTIFSVIVFPLTLLAAIFGMNTINTPVIGHPHDFWILVGVMLLGTVGMLSFFRAKHWL